MKYVFYENIGFDCFICLFCILLMLCYGVCVLKCVNVFNLLCELFVWLVENFLCDFVGKKDCIGVLYFIVYIFYIFICIYVVIYFKKKKGWVRLIYVFKIKDYVLM